MERGRILITGITGFIGSELHSFLKNQGFEVFGTSTSAAGNKNIFQADITKPEELEKLPSPDIMIHLAAARETFGNLEKNKMMCHRVNVEGTYNVASFGAARKARHLIYISTNNVYVRSSGKKSTRPREESKTAPTGEYGKTKLLGEKVCEKVCQANKMGLTILRLSSVFGAKQKQFLISHIIRCLRSGKDITIFGKGEGKWDLIYIKDLCALLSKIVSSIMEKDLEGKAKHETSGIFNVGSGRLVSVRDIVLIARNVFSESKSKIIYDRGQPENTDNMIMDISKAKKNLGWLPNYSLEESLLDIKKELSSKP